MPMASLPAFLPQPILLPVATRSTRSAICMRRKDSPKKKKSTATSRLSKEEKANLDRIAEEYGIRPPRPGDQLDRKYTQKKPTEQKTLYQSLAGAFGVPTLNAIEQGLYVVLGGLLFFLLTTGLAISSEAFFKASGKPIPDSLDAFATNVQNLFSPALLSFLVLSSLFGIFKQSQLESGTSSYSSLKEKE
ncbi:unnamed protein product [Agarophyton chilense]